jgi:hypothetical protein
LSRFTRCSPIRSFGAEPIGVWWSFAAGLAITIAWSSALWLLRRARLRLA